MQVLNNNNLVVGDGGGAISWFSPTGQLIHSMKNSSGVGVTMFSIDQTNNLLVLGRERDHIFEIYTKPDAIKIKG